MMCYRQLMRCSLLWLCVIGVLVKGSSDGKRHDSRDLCESAPDAVLPVDVHAMRSLTELGRVILAKLIKEYARIGLFAAVFAVRAFSILSPVEAPLIGRVTEYILLRTWVAPAQRRLCRCRGWCFCLRRRHTKPSPRRPRP